MSEIKIRDTRDEINAEDKLRLLETFDFNPKFPQLIEYKTTEFSAVCPGTGLPDIGTLTIQYYPREKCLELKSLKYYLFSYREDGIFQEPVTDLIFEHLWAVMDPHYLRIHMVYNTRGGFDTTTVTEKGAKLE